MATESGIPDFRSPTGIWTSLDPMEYATLSAFRRDPAKVWWFYRKRIEMLTAAEPNQGHIALRELERRGLITGIVTQNIDMLHTHVGAPTSSRCADPSARPVAKAARERTG